MYDVTFRNRHTNSTDVRRLKKIGWHNNLKIDVLRAIAFVDVFKLFMLKDSSTSEQSIRNAMSGVRNDLKDFFNIGGDPIEHNRKNKGWTTPIKITLLDGDEYMINMSEKLEQKALEDIGSTHKNAPDYNDAYDGSGVYVSLDEDDNIL